MEEVEKRIANLSWSLANCPIIDENKISLFVEDAITWV